MSKTAREHMSHLALRNRIADALFDLKIVQFGKFRLKHHDEDPAAPFSPFYINLKLIFSFPYLFRTLMPLLNESAELCGGFRYVAGVPLGGVPFATLLAMEFEKPLLFPRERKRHGSESAIEGTFVKGYDVLLVEDVVTTAGSALRIRGSLCRNGLRVSHVLALVDREQGGCRALWEKKCTLHSVFTIRALLNRYLETGRITRACYEETYAYLGLARKENR